MDANEAEGVARRTRWIKRTIVGAVALVVLLVIVTGPSDEEVAQAEVATRATALASAVPVTARTLADAYADNEIRAAAQYAGALTVTGTVAAIGRNDVQQPWLALDGAQVVTVIEASDTEKVAGMSRGDLVTVQCTESFYIERVLRLDECTVG